MRRVAAFAIIAIAALTLVYGVWKQDANRTETDTASPAAQRAYPDVVTVYYFHGHTRCDTCLDIEAKTVAAIENNFADAVESGRMQFEIVNFDQPEHAHFRDDYDLAYGTVVVQGIGDDHPWVDLADVWTYVHEPPAEFEKYLVSNITAMLDPAG
jgi:hypothetical protein